VTVPVARASARRTVRVAAGLVAGQAVLCAVIGYITLGDHGSGGTAVGRMRNPLAAEPFAPSAPAVPIPSPSTTTTTAAPEPPPVPRLTAVRRPASERSRQRPAVTPPPTSAAESAPGILIAPPPSTTAPATAPPSLPPSASTSETPSSETGAPSPPVSQSTDFPVTDGEVCAPVDAQGTTTDGKAALCVSGTDGVLRWRTIE
jgi:hypothetical protein